MTIGVDGIERDPVRVGKCYSCAYTFHIWVCPTCEGPYIEAACKVCHDERRHGAITPPRYTDMNRVRAPSMNPRSTLKTATGEAFGARSKGWSGTGNKSVRKHK